MMRKKAFTIPEALVATAIATLVMTIVTGLIVGMMKDWRIGSARADLGLQARMLRERLLYGIEGQFGLIHASRTSIVYTNRTLQFRDSESTNHFALLLEPDQPVRVRNAAGTNVVTTRSDILLQSAAIIQTGHVLILDLALFMNDGRVTHVHPQQMRVYLLNE